MVPRPPGHGGGGRRLDSQGRGSIRYARVGSGPLLRIDNFLMPLSELGCTKGQSIGFTRYLGGLPRDIKRDDPNLDFQQRTMRVGFINVGLRFNPASTFRIDGSSTIDPNLVPDDYPNQSADSVAETDPRLHNVAMMGQAAAR